MFRLPEIFADSIRDAQERSDKIYEAIVAIVVDNVDPLKHGRVRLTFPTMPGNDASYWAPITSMGAGTQRGWFFLPEIDDEVVVMFEHGDVRRPIVIGALWNGVDDPPDANGGSNERRVLHSREGSRIEFDDDKGTISISDGAGIASITIDAKANHIKLETSGDVCLQAPEGDVEMVAKDISIKGSKSFLMHSDMGMSLGGMEITIEGKTKLEVGGKPLNLQPGGVQPPQGAKASVAEIPDPLTEYGGRK